MKIRVIHKLMLMTCSLLALAVLSITVSSTWKATNSITDVAKQDLAHLSAMATNLCKLSAENAKAQVTTSMELAKESFADYSGGQISVTDGKMTVGSRQTSKVINDNYEFVDRIKKGTGASCTIFLREGDKARRISTNVMNDDGSRAVGTFVSQPIYDAVIRDGRPYQGRAWVVREWCETSYQPILDNERKVVGILYVGVPERSLSLRSGLLAQKVGKTGYIYAMDSKGVLQIHPAKEKSDISSNDFAKEMIAKAPQLADGEIGWVHYPWINKELGETTPREKIVAYTYFKDWDWIIASGSYLDEFTAPTVALRNSNIILGLVALVIAILLTYWFALTLTRPITKLTEAAEAISLGNTEVSIAVERNDELGMLASSFAKIIEYLQHTANQARRIADGDLTVEVALRSSNDNLGKSFQVMVTSLTSMVRQLGDNVRELVSASNEIASSAEQMSKGAKNQADQVNLVATSIEEMTAAMFESSKNAGDASTAAKGAAETAKIGGGIVNDSIEAMQTIEKTVQQSAESITKLASSADQIGDIINVIDDIADQTNLLALNAAIEAARAGEQGRGFAVVADEVRKLAERTGKATGEIAAMIKGIQKDTSDAVQSMQSGMTVVDQGRNLVTQAGQSLSEIVAMAQRVTAMIQQMASAAEEQSSASEQISQNVEHIAAVTKETSSGAEQSATAAEELSRQSESLRMLVEKYKIDGVDLQILTLAKNDHQQFMKRLKALLDGTTDVKAWKYGDHQSCRLGVWYYAAGKMQYSGRQEFEAIEPPHEEVHKYGNESVRAFVHGDRAAAQRHYETALKASQAVIARLGDLERSTSSATVR